MFASVCVCVCAHQSPMHLRQSTLAVVGVTVIVAEKSRREERLRSSFAPPRNCRRGQGPAGKKRVGREKALTEVTAQTSSSARGRPAICTPRIY